ncbi:MAG TPA: aminotransferase class I/II-fold pyridoxal phosphate-dependent enzyme [Ktedonobacterales bacterium]|nr:aminotransferase class I/II-fold pyridoxal phosphate-dependent enzyme [Ktedonobacterales bacterium]
MSQPTLGPWATEAVNRRYAELAARSADLAGKERLLHLIALVDEQARLVDRECLNLNPATNAQNPYGDVLMASGIGTRPSLGHPGDKYETGLGPGEEIEVLANELARRVFRVAFAETRLLSGAMANLAVFMATARPGDVIFTLPPAAGGHATHQPFGAAGLYGLDVRPIPLIADEASATWRIDLDALAEQAEATRPRLIALGGSLAFAPYSIREVRAIAESVGARLLFDAAHLSLLIAGEAFQQPLEEGAEVMTTSTYKALGGPPGGLLLTNDAELAARIDAIVYPGLTANNDLGRVAALAVCLNDLLVYGHDYAARCVETARALAQALAATGLPIAGHAPDYTQTHHLALDARRWGGGTRAARLLEPANILATGINLPLPDVPDDQNGLRLGVQELVRWGLGPAEMPQVASFLARVLLRGEEAAALRDEVVTFRARFQELCYMLDAT